MAKSVLELAVNTGKWDAGIKKAQTSLNNFIDANGGLQKTLQKDSSSVQQFVTMMGKIDSTAKTGKGQINDYRAAFEQLSRVYGQLTEQEKQSPLGQSMAQSLDQIKQKAAAARQELEEINKSFNGIKAPDGGGAGGGFGDLTTALFGADLAAGLAKDALSAVGEVIADTTRRAVELSTQAEGVRMAFDRLNRPDLLEQLRAATHGTVNDIELMKAAVKFDDFNLSIDELGTMLAFAQQKAKDTGQSVDYLVDSIVTGLGRQSTQILDNLGLSQAEVKQRTQETGDMTVAVGQIIREQMQAAGDYVETAADRAAAANAELDNLLVELGDRMRETFGIGSMEEFSVFMQTRVAEAILYTVEWFNDAKTAIDKVWNSYMELTAPLNAVYNKVEDIANSNAVTRWMFKIQSLIHPLTQAYTLIKMIGNELGLGGGGGGVGSTMSRVSGYIGEAKNQGNGDKYTVVSRGGKVMSATHTGADGSVIDYTSQAQGRAAAGGGKKGGGRGGRGGGGRSGGSATQKQAPVEGSIDWQAAKVKELQEAWRAAADDDARAKIKKQLDEANAVLEKMEGKVKEEKAPEMAEGISGVNAEAFDAMIKTYQDMLKSADFGSALYENLSNNLADTNTLKSVLQYMFQNGITGVEFNAEELWNSILGGENIPDSVWEELQEEINAKLAEMDLEPIKINVKTGGIEKTKKETEGINKSLGTAAQAAQAIGSALNQVENPAAKVLGIIAQAIATVAQGMASALASKETTGTGIWGWVAAAAAGVATMVSTISAIHSATGYAEGGIIKGNHNSGDLLMGSVNGTPVGLNSGELILNRAQQYNIANALDGGMQNLHLTATLRGEDLRLSMNANGRRTGRGEYVTTKFK
jgi:myosin heavy subunit